ncbi:MAG: aspartate carbamoyltransferase catalytic subunit [Anaeroplasmataceae bacterium]
MRNLLTLNDLTESDINTILSDASKFKNGYDFNLKGKIACNLFFENSTRTHYSFVIAQEKLDMKQVSFNQETSSINKGESFYDTIKTFEAFNPNVLIVRHKSSEFFNELKDVKCPIINAGSGTLHHPTQNLIDLFTIYEEFKTFKNINIMIVGDIIHSRVFNGCAKVLKDLGMNVYISGPKQLMDKNYEYVDIDKDINKMDVVMMLRVQLERHEDNITLDNEYLNKYGLTLNRVNKMKDKSIIMHPAPFNRGVEIESEVIDHIKSRIFNQMTNGVYIRESILKWCLE